MTEAYRKNASRDAWGRKNFHRFPTAAHGRQDARQGPIQVVAAEGRCNLTASK
jgi:hypothetical protein